MKQTSSELKYQTRVWMPPITSIRELYFERTDPGHFQWHNRRRRQGAKCPRTLLTGKFQLTHREKRENGEKKEEKLKGKVENFKWKEKKNKNSFAIHFSKPLKFVLGLPKWEFSTGKKAFHADKK